MRTRILLGLGLNFCLRPNHTTKCSDVDFGRFQRDCYTRMFFAGNDTPLPANKLFVRSDWSLAVGKIPADYRYRIDAFAFGAGSLFKPQRCPSNLLPSQRHILETIRDDDKIVVFKTDKNLGPAIIERTTYIRRALADHLFDTTTYRCLSTAAAMGRMKSIRFILGNFIDRQLPPKSSDRTFLLRHLALVKDDFSYFYLLAKIHKTPWSTRPIVSVSGSLLHGLGLWTDAQLQLICKRLPFVLTSSTKLVRQLRHIRAISTTRLFTCDAVSMYTNIDTAHALAVIANFFSQSAIPAAVGVDVGALLAGLTIVMSHNVFRFGDTYWVQLTGTAMGTPPAPMYATLYFAIHEMEIIKEFATELQFYGRYIDDGFGVWTPDPSLSDCANTARFNLFQRRFDDFGKLRWTFSALSLSLDFLDVTLTIDNGNIDSMLFEKALNLYLYLPPHSNHPPGVLKGLIRGMFLRVSRLTSNEQLRHAQLKRFFHRLLLRGYSFEFLRPLFRPLEQRPHVTATDNAMNRPIYLHLPFHSQDPSSRLIQSSFRQTMLVPLDEPPLPSLRNNTGHSVGIEQLTVAYHRSRNIGNVLSRRRLPVTGVAVSSIIAREHSTPPNPNPTPI